MTQSGVTRPDACSYFSLGAWGLPINAIAVVWGAFVVINISWPRAEVYGSGRFSRFAAPLATLGLVATGSIYYLLVQRNRTGILTEHAASDLLDEESSTTTGALPTEHHWIGQLAHGDQGV